MEVVDWVSRVDSPMQPIEQKCRRAYPNFFSLLVLARSGKTAYPQEIAREIRKLTVPFAEIWILGRASEQDTKVHVVKVHPFVLHADFDIRHALKKAKNEADILQPQQRGTSIEFRHLGQVYLPIP